MPAIQAAVPAPERAPRTGRAERGARSPRRSGAVGVGQAPVVEHVELPVSLAPPTTRKSVSLPRAPRATTSPAIGT